MLISSEVHGPPCCPGSNGTDITWHIKVTFMKSCSNIIQEHQLKNETSYVKGLNIYLKKHTSVWFYCLQGWQRIDNNRWRHLGSMYFVPKRKKQVKKTVNCSRQTHNRNTKLPSNKWYLSLFYYNRKQHSCFHTRLMLPFPQNIQ